MTCRVFRKYKTIICWMVTIWLMTACDSQTRYHQFRHINEEGWRKADTIDFEVPLQDSLQSHTMKLQLRHTSRYPYKDLHIAIRILSHDSQYNQTALFNAMLMREQGYWKGKGQGGLYQTDIGETQLPPSHRGNWHIMVYHAMDDSLLVGIHDIGVEVSALTPGINSQENKQ